MTSENESKTTSNVRKQPRVSADTDDEELKKQAVKCEKKVIDSRFALMEVGGLTVSQRNFPNSVKVCCTFKKKAFLQLL